MIPGIGPMEVAIVVVLLLIVFGPKRLPGLGRSLGSGIRGFRREVDDVKGLTGGEPEAVSESPESKPAA